MAYREVERLRGSGTISKVDGTVIGKRSYDLTVSQRMLDAGRGETIPGLFRIRGFIRLHGHEGLSFVTDNAELVLELEDGRSLPFFFSSSDGEIAARGGLKTRERA